MTWIDIRVQKPTEDDADSRGFVLQVFSDKSAGVFPWDVNHAKMVAWMPIPEFSPAPDPPDGYRFADTRNEAFRSDALFDEGGSWEHTRQLSEWNCYMTYVVPIEIARPKYRPFKNAEEYDIFRNRWWRFKDTPGDRRPPSQYCDFGYSHISWAECLETMEFDDGQPFGVAVSEE